jgi:cell wall-associated NlpC family hydrolase
LTRWLAALLIGIAVFATGAGIGTATAAPAVPDQTATTQRAAPSGQWIADYALDYVGYPYAYAGNTPSGFDCSGFTQYVVGQTLGIDIGHGVEGQTWHGAWVGWEDWQPGDLIFFAGTYRPGISHVGIYIGGGEFVHAENESTGVVVSSIYSNYYTTHYNSAYRLV